MVTLDSMVGLTPYLSDDVVRVQEENCHASFSRLMDEYAGMVRRVVYRIILNHHDTDDVVQETFIRAFQKINSFKGKSAFSTWLCRIACNQAYSHLRRRKEAGIDTERVQVIPGSNAIHPDAAIKTREAFDEITGALARLPEEQRAAITLTAIEGMSAKDAAYALDCNLMTFYWRLKQARKRLSTELTDLLN